VIRTPRLIKERFLWERQNHKYITGGECKMLRKEYERVSPESVGIPSAAIWRMIEELEKVTEMHGIMVMRHGKVCAEGWWSPYGPGVHHGLQSLTKTYTATAIGIAYTEKKLRLDERLVDLFPEYLSVNVSENLKKLTVYDLLIMSTGMESEKLGGPNWIREFLSTTVAHEPGTTFFYNTAGSGILGEVIRVKTGMSLHEYLCEKLFCKLGIDEANIGWLRSQDGHEIGGGGMLATTEDNLRLMDLYRQGGVWENERILAGDFVEMATKKQIDTYNAMTNGPLATDHLLGYGFQMWMCQPEGAYRSDGAFGQYGIVFPKQDMIISLNESGAQDDNGTQRPLDAVYTILKELSDEPLPEDPEACARLRHRMQHLAIERPDFQPNSPLTSQLSGKWFKVRSGSMFLAPSKVSFIDGKSTNCDISAFKFDFGVNECTLTYLCGDGQRTLDIAMDGTRRLNNVFSLESPFHKCYASAYWAEPNKLRLVCRWIESAYEHRLTFVFDGVSAWIGCDDLVLFAPNNQVPALAVRA